MAGPTSRGKLRKTGCSSKKLILPRVQMNITDKVGRKETRGNKTTALHIFGRHTKTHILEESKLRMTKAETKRPNKCDHGYSQHHKLENIRRRINRKVIKGEKERGISLMTDFLNRK